MTQVRLQIIASLAVASLLATLLAGCGSSEPLPKVPANCTVPDANTNMVDVYFGCGCFWHMQHGFVVFEMTDLCRKGGDITARAAYAGGLETGPDGLVCYHNMQGTADYGQLGHAEVVSMKVPEAHFGAFAAKFFELCPGGVREDTQDGGGEYRSVVGLPGGMSSPLKKVLQEKAGSTKLTEGKGNEGDTLNARDVLVYDTSSFPAYTAEKYHQFHDDMIDAYGAEYNSLKKYAKATSCPGDESSFVA